MSEPCHSSSVQRRERAEETANGNDRAHTSSPRLQDLPLEILERILNFVFLQTSPTTPSSPPRRLYRHLTLVSHSFRQLVLPFLFTSILIARPSDFITFFDPKHGLLVAGENGRKRWNYVKEIRLVRKVSPPLSRVYVEDGPFTTPLALPTGRRVDHFCILDAPVFPTSWIEQDGVRELVIRLQQEPRRRIETEARLRGFYEDDARTREDGTLLTFMEWLDDPEFETEEEAKEVFVSRLIASELKSRHEDEQADFFDAFILATSPRILRDRYPPVLNLNMRAPGAEEAVQVGIFAQHWNDSSYPTKAFLYHAMERFGKTTNAGHIHFVDYPSDVREKFIAWIKRKGVQTTTISVAFWSWEEDGKVMQLDMSDL